jgi:hypothetical protein
MARWFDGKSVAIVGSGPGATKNERGAVDRNDVVVRVNNYKLEAGTGRRTDVFYSFFGPSIKKTADELVRDGVKLCMCKCPDAKFMESDWHRTRNKPYGVDFRYVYERRAGWWFCDTYVPSVDDFIAGFELLGGHIPTTGFAAILDVLSCNPRAAFLTGFDFFRSRVHNVNEPWRQKNTDDPIRHEPEREFLWLRENWSRYPIEADETLARLL